MQVQATSLDAYHLLHNGSIALATVEANGIRVDVDYLNRTTEKIGRKIKRLQNLLREDETYRLWHRAYGEKTNLGSREQLAHILFDKIKIPYKGDYTKTGRYK